MEGLSWRDFIQLGDRDPYSGHRVCKATCSKVGPASEKIMSNSFFFLLVQTPQTRYGVLILCVCP